MINTSILFHLHYSKNAQGIASGVGNSFDTKALRRSFMPYPQSSDNKCCEQKDGWHVSHGRMMWDMRYEREDADCKWREFQICRNSRHTLSAIRLRSWRSLAVLHFFVECRGGSWMVIFRLYDKLWPSVFHCFLYPLSSIVFRVSSIESRWLIIGNRTTVKSTVVITKVVTNVVCWLLTHLFAMSRSKNTILVPGTRYTIHDTVYRVVPVTSVQCPGDRRGARCQPWSLIDPLLLAFAWSTLHPRRNQESGIFFL